MDLRLGFFTEFKGTDSVLLEGSSLGIERLASAVAQFVASSEEALPIHSLAWVAPHHPVQLLATRMSSAPASFEPPLFMWPISSGELPGIQAKLLQLSQAASGHQYFDLAGFTTQLIISVGEYGESWWRIHG